MPNNPPFDPGNPAAGINNWVIPWTPANDAFFPNDWQLPGSIGAPAGASGLGINNPPPAQSSIASLPAFDWSMPAARRALALPLPPPETAFAPPIFLKDYLPGGPNDPWNNQTPPGSSTSSKWNESQSILYGITKLRDTPSLDDPQTASLGIIPAPKSSPYVGPGIVPAPKGYRPPPESPLRLSDYPDLWSTFAAYVPPSAPGAEPRVYSRASFGDCKARCRRA
jgi:hypothetical protein